MSTSSNRNHDVKERPLPKNARVLMVGCGGVGGVCAAGLATAGHRVHCVTKNPNIADAIAADGLSADVEGETLRGEVTAEANLSKGSGPFDVAFFASPPNTVDAAVTAALGELAPHAPLVFFQNGLVEERVEESVEPDRVLGAIVGFGASMLGPGRVEKTSSGGYTVGRLSGEIDDTVRWVGDILSASSSVELTDNLRGARWSKLAINCAISSLGTIGGQRLGSLMRHRFVRRLALETMTEVTQVALGSGVNLEKVSGTLDLEWLALDDDERLLAGSPSLVAKHTVLLAVGAKYRRLRSSMLAAIERGREPPVDFLNGEVVSRGAKLGVDVPVNTALLETVHAIGRGDVKPSLATLRGLFDSTRESLRALELAA